ncbi:MAG TPA: GNAT family N-acetyltransferase [Xanthobacteraceae bacterium]|nr:GNAT family N-acetyltransferase [Xanthobacteraceae bacterium]
MSASVTLRGYRVTDEAAALDLWRRSWQLAYPHIDFTARLDWWRERWRRELAPTADIVIAETAGQLVGFVTVDARTGYLDQIVTAPETWGIGTAAALLAEAKRLAPTGLRLHVNQDNARALRFYKKNGFVIAGPGPVSRSGAATYEMTWKP